MCKKPLKSIPFNFAIYAISLGVISAGSGGALRLGAFIMQQQDPNNTEYPLYVSQNGFKIGLNSALYFSWLTAAFLSMFVINAQHEEKTKRHYRLLLWCFEAIILTAAFDLLHYKTLPMATQSEVGCTALNLHSLKTEKRKNVLCDTDHQWDSLYKAFYLGAGISEAGCLMLCGILLTCYHLITDTKSIHTLSDKSNDTNIEMQDKTNQTSPSPINLETRDKKDNIAIDVPASPITQQPTNLKPLATAEHHDNLAASQEYPFPEHSAFNL